MGIYQNYAPSNRMLELQGVQCPRCAQPAVPAGMYFLNEVTVPLNVRFLFFSISLSLRVKLAYCPKCGFLRMEIVKAG